jgi:hypothetical protein
VIVAKGGVKVKTDKVSAVLKGIHNLTAHRVMVGIPSTKAVRDIQTGEPINNAALGYIHEHGAPEVNIPARPFLLPGVRSIRGEIVKRLRDAAKVALHGSPRAVMRAYHALGLLAQRTVRQKITEGPFVPLSPATLYRRQHRKVAPRKGTRPLIDTGQLRRAIDYVIRKR